MELRPLKRDGRSVVEAALKQARRRERESDRIEQWSQKAHYYDVMNTVSQKNEQFTSPRYYASQQRKWDETKRREEKAERLQRRRDQLKKLFDEENASFQIELTMHRAAISCHGKHNRSYNNDKENPELVQQELETLRGVRKSLKEEEEERRRRLAEHALYRQWRDQSHVLREVSTQIGAQDVKLSWLDQQIEKRMTREREEKEAREWLEQHERLSREQRAKEEEFEAQIKEERAKLEQDLLQQMDLIRAKESESQRLLREEKAEQEAYDQLRRLEEERDDRHRRLACKSVTLYNAREVRRKLEERTKEERERLEADREFVAKMCALEACERVRDELKKRELRHSMDEFLTTMEELKEAEKKRREHLLFTFESEAASVLRSLERTWAEEQRMRQGLLKQLTEELKSQLEANKERDRERQETLLKERERILEDIENHRQHIKAMEEDHRQRKEEYKKLLDEQVAEKTARKKKLVEIKKKSTADELESMRREEERLKQEIMNLQKGKPQKTYGRRNFFY